MSENISVEQRILLDRAKSNSKRYVVTNTRGIVIFSGDDEKEYLSWRAKYLKDKAVDKNG